MCLSLTLRCFLLLQRYNMYDRYPVDGEGERLMNEHAHLINDYLCLNPNVCNNGFFAISFADLDAALHNLVKFERPDMYAELEKKIVLLEHFEFDASRTKRKSMEGKRAESLLNKKIEASPPDGQIRLEKPSYEISLRDWQKNFDRCFNEHYSKIEQYTENVLARTGIVNKEVIVGFVVEDQFPPYVKIDGHGIGVLPYVCTTQFAEVFQQSTNLDFVLYTYMDGGPKVIYMDRESLQGMRGLIDLEDEKVSISRLKENTVVLYGSFEIEQL